MREYKSASSISYPRQPLCRMIAGLMLGLAATMSLALAASEEVSHNGLTHQQVSNNTSTPAAPAANLLANANSDKQTSADIRQDLLNIITSSDYAESKQIKSWQPIEKPASNKKTDLNWLGKLLKWLFGSQADFGMAALLSLLLKGLLVVALLAFIVWVARRAGYLQGWLGTMKSRISRSSRIEPYNLMNAAAQSWQALPSHEQIPTAVAAHLQQGQLTAAASMLYRGSLRWLMLAQQLTIAPAMTEKQCLAQIDQLNKSDQHHYISGLIKLWLQVAYNSTAGSSLTSSLAVENSADSRTNLATQIHSVASRWLIELPTVTAQNTTANMSAKPMGDAAEVTDAK